MKVGRLAPTLDLHLDERAFLHELGEARTGLRSTVVWPSGYRVRVDGDTLVLADRFGTIKARQGDTIEVGGGVGDDGLFRACGDVWTVSPSPT